MTPLDLLIAAVMLQQAALPKPPALDPAGDAAFAARHWSEAVAAYEKSLESAPGAAKSAALYRRIGLAKGSLGDHEGSLAAYRIGLTAGETAGDLDLIEENLHGLGLELIRLGRIREAGPPAEREHELSRRCGHGDHMVRALYLVARIYGLSGRTRLAIGTLEEGLAVARRVDDRRGAAIILDNLATQYFSLGDREYAAKLEHESIDLGDPGRFDAEGALKIAMIRYAGSDSVRALEAFREVVRLSVEPEQANVRAAALAMMAEVYTRRGQHESAVAYVRQALESAQQGHREDQRSELLSLLAESLLALHKLEAAGKAASEALILAQQAGAPNWEFTARTVRGRIEEASGRPVEARVDFQAAVDIAEFLRAEAPGDPAQLRKALENHLVAYRLLTENLVAAGDPESAFQIAEKAKARVLIDILLGPGLDESSVLTPADRERARVLRAAATKGSSEAVRELDRLRRRIYSEHPELALQSGKFQTPDPSALASLARDKVTRFVEYFRTTKGWLAFIVDGKVTAHPVRLNPTEIEAFRGQLARRDLNYKAAARRLYTALIAPVFPELKGAQKLVISPDGELWELPFAALVDSSDRHLLERYSLSIAPSFAALAALAGRPDGGRKTVLLAGLPEELQAIAPSYLRRETVVTANLADFQKQAPEARIIHLAGHGELNNHAPLYSEIVFNDAKLTASDLMDMRLHADLVVLSACETARGYAEPGEGIIGLGWALAVAGARSSILSYWKVGSAPTTKLMVAFHANFAGSHRAPESLRSGTLALLSDPATRHPYYWAGFVVTGGL
jgi:CHAT domain-containing protein/tetratricopeptide (TPR) repeat protein